jgi:signal transduction histidine kinase
MMAPFYDRTNKRQQTLQLQLSADAPHILSDRASLERILAELLNNACKYTPTDGTIRVEVSHTLKTASEPQSVIRFVIANEQEIPAAELPRIFEKFYRVPNADPWKQGGTGLGLALVQRLVERLKGTITVDSAAGWTTFALQFPLQANLSAAED